MIRTMEKEGYNGMQIGAVDEYKLKNVSAAVSDRRSCSVCISGINIGAVHEMFCMSYLFLSIKVYKCHVR